MRAKIMPNLTVVAKLVARQEDVEDVKDWLTKMVVPTRCESGCIEYILHQDNTNPAVFIFYENWANFDCLGKHRETAHYKECFGAISNMILEKEVHLMKIID
jgi:quinol monooxygenase YgiN